jgi:catechol 2,3-dioxygenase-like lactoylglutathione lyase family enzyme
MKQFYHELLGFPLYRNEGYWIALRIGEMLIGLRARGMGHNGVKDFDGAPPPEHAPSIQLAFRVTPNELERCYVELQQKGITIVQPPTDQDDDHRTIFFKDPEGNLLEIYAPL